MNTNFYKPIYSFVNQHKLHAQHRKLTAAQVIILIT